MCREWIDEVLVVTPEEIPYPDKLLEQFAETGVTVHLNLAKINSESGKRQFVEKIGNYTVLTTSINYASARQLLSEKINGYSRRTGRLHLYRHPVYFCGSGYLYCISGARSSFPRNV